MSTPPATTSILLVDDQPENLTALRAILSDESYRLVTAASGKDALLRILSEDFAVILLDVRLPDIDGFEVASLVKQRERSRHTPIIFLTAATDDLAAIYRAYAVGGVDYLLKPLEPEVVQAKVAVFVELHRRGEQIKEQAELLRQAEQRRRDAEVEDLRRAAQARYQHLADAIPQCVFTAKLDGGIDYVSSRWLEYTGLAFEALRGWGWQAAVHPNDLNQFVSKWRRCLESGEPFQGECRLRSIHGAYRWHLCRAVPERDVWKRVVAWLGSFTDIDDSKRHEQERLHLLTRERAARAEAEAAVRRSEILAEASSSFSASLDEDSVAAALVRISAERVCTWCVLDLREEGGARRLAAAHRARDAARFMERFGPRELTLTADGVGAVLTTGRPDLRVECAPRDVAVALDIGDPAVIQEIGASSYLCVPLVTRGEVLGALSMVWVEPGERFEPPDFAVALDVAQRAALCLENARLLRMTREAVQIREDFVAVASHELRTPLSALVLQVQGLTRALHRADGGLPAEQVLAKLSQAGGQIDRLTRLIDTLLDVARINSGHLELSLDDVDLCDVARDVAGRLEAELERAGCTLDLDMPVTAVGRWDRLRIDQVITNLLVNAIKYGRGKPIQVRISVDGRSAVLQVADQGIGIAQEYIARIFGRFERAAPTSSYGGLGVGLYIVDQILRAHGGSIQVESAPGMGARFQVALPLPPRAAGPSGPLGERPGSSLTGPAG
ncbi:ATP-binding protein [Sorangium sp. So ce726]|uniref:hybrid sensor histidine kinase/response regulator n=1 Tax=Sorangium sp. So ce726 TaxID=3133319 RepID=UPI003F604038